MAYTEDHIALAAEYALGTLDADERAQVETMMAVDKEFTAIVHAWEFRLGVLNQMVGSVEPRPIVWENIKAAIGQAAAPQEPLVLPEAPSPPPPVEEVRPVEGDTIRQVPIVDNTNVVYLEGRVKRWRNIASAVGALAAALVVMMALQVYQPDVLPGALRPAPRIQTVEVKTPAAPLASSSQYVALLQGQSGGPAFILTIDGATKNFTVRKVGATPEAGKSYELWLISDKLPRPRSLGVIGNGDFTARPVLSSYDADVINAATFAVTVEPAGGSPSGQPTSAPLFSGKLIETVPPSQPQAPAK
ncbi:anti-sigma factor domain-containing protein [Bradyrhizobium liaoningense]|uniref:anti-sigma factor n=1 Tax=Bradyrhizobium liaoningense TaxID=43992 RepID=UPI001BA7DA74|nr:anti-sigma factor [Bradyrhizobium liaoningense]MBR0719362.1 anti-sigma factor [Bradyrhizobium liaoningense]